MAHIKCVSFCMLAAATEASSAKGANIDFFSQRSVKPIGQDQFFDVSQNQAPSFFTGGTSDIFGEQASQPLAVQQYQPKDVATLASGNSLHQLLALTQTPVSQQPQAAVSQLQVATLTAQHAAALRGGLLQSVATQPPQPQAPTSFLKKAVMLQAIRPVAVPQLQVPEVVRKTMQAIDRNGDGLADYSEIAAFSTGQGQHTAEDEFKTIDKDGSGSIDMNELAVTLGVSPVSTEQSVASQRVAAPQPQSATVAVQRKAASQTDPLAASAQQIAAIRTAQSQKATLELPVHPQTDSDAVLTERDTTKQAMSAQAATAFMSSQLQLQMTKEAEAGQLDAAAAELRAKADVSSRTAEMRMSEAGANAATEASEELVKKLAKLEAEAEKSEAGAAALRAKGHAEASAAADLMSAAEAAMQTK